MDRIGIKRPRLAAELGVSYVAVKKVLDGQTKAFTAENNSRAAAFLGVSPDWLATGEGDMLPAGGSAEAPNVTALPAPALRGLSGVLTELQTVMDGLSPLLQVAAKAVVHQWLDGHASLADVVTTIEGMQQIGAGTTPDLKNRAA